MSQMNSNQFCFLDESKNNNNNNNNKYHQIPQHENSEKVWVNNFRGCIVETNYQPKTNSIIQYSMPFNQPQQYKNYFDSTHVKNQVGSCKNVNNNLYLTNHVNVNVRNASKT